MLNKVTQEQIDRIITEGTIETQTMGKKTTVVRFISKEGFVIIESSSCVDKANYDVNLGKKYCLEKIISKLWEYEGYCLQKAMFCAKETTAKERVEQEKTDLKTKIESLNSFLLSRKYDEMPLAAQKLLVEQLEIMSKYVLILDCRLSVWED